MVGGEGMYLQYNVYLVCNVKMIKIKIRLME